MKQLTRLVLVLPPFHSEEEANRLLALLSLHVSHGWEEQSLPTGEVLHIVHFSEPRACDVLCEAAQSALSSLSIKSELTDEEDWAEVWKEYFTPVQGGSRFLVLAPWMQKERAATTRIPVIITPKTAFGTGHHASTALCLEAISNLYDQGRLKKGMRFLDIGTGSGILGIACAKLGLCGEGLDIDETSLVNARENRTTNGIAEKDFFLILGSVEEARGPYDLVLANILAEPLQEMAPRIASLPGKGSARPLVVLSGLLDIQAKAVEQAYQSWGLPWARSMLREEWAALVFDPSGNEPPFFE